MPILVLLNPSAGTARRRDPDALRDLVRDRLAGHGLEADVEFAAGDEIAARAGEFVSKMHGREDGLLVVGGGDGTVGCAVSKVAGTRVTLGMLPLGTFNHFARDVGIPGHLDAAIDVVASGEACAVDVAEMNDRTFVNNSSIGIYPFLVAERTAEQRRRGVGKIAAIVPALARTLRADTWQRVRILAGPDHRAVRTPCVFVGNNFYDMAAVGRRQSLSGRTLCVYIVKPQTRLGLLLLPFKVALGIVHPETDVELLRVEALEIHARRRQIRVSVDGETIKSTTPLRYRIRPGALRIVVPSAASRERAEIDASGQSA